MKRIHFGLRIKLIAIALLGAVIVMSASLTGIWYVTEKYNQEIYAKNVMNIEYISNTIQTELQTISFFMDAIMTDSIYLANLKILNKKDVPYVEIVQAHLKIARHAESIIVTNDNIDSVTFVVEERVINAGTSFELSKEQQEYGRQQAIAALGRSVYVYFENQQEEPGLYLVRQIRSYPFNYTESAVVYMKINISRMIEDILSRNTKSVSGGKYYLVDKEGELLYPMGENKGMLDDFSSDEDAGYLIKKKDGTRYFICWKCR